MRVSMAMPEEMMCPTLASSLNSARGRLMARFRNPEVFEALTQLSKTRKVLQSPKYTNVQMRADHSSQSNSQSSLHPRSISNRHLIKAFSSPPTSSRISRRKTKASQCHLQKCKKSRRTRSRRISC